MMECSQVSVTLFPYTKLEVEAVITGSPGGRGLIWGLGGLG